MRYLYLCVYLQVCALVQECDFQTGHREEWRLFEDRGMGLREFPGPVYQCKNAYVNHGLMTT